MITVVPKENAAVGAATISSTSLSVISKNRQGDYTMNEHENAILFDDLTEEELKEFTEGLIPADAGDEGWKIVNDSAADWAVRKIKEEQDEYARLNALAHDQISEINMNVEAAEKRMENRTGYLKSKLAEYFMTVPHRETKTQAKYRLLSGELVYTKPKYKIEKSDEAALVQWLKETGNTEFVKTVETPAWGEFKKRCAIAGAAVVDTDTGEVVEGMRVVPVEGTFDVK